MVLGFDVLFQNGSKLENLIETKIVRIKIVYNRYFIKDLMRFDGLIIIDRFWLKVQKNGRFFNFTAAGNTFGRLWTV